jgi:hypothetical protein
MQQLIAAAHLIRWSTCARRFQLAVDVTRAEKGLAPRFVRVYLDEPAARF